MFLKFHKARFIIRIKIHSPFTGTLNEITLHYRLEGNIIFPAGKIYPISITYFKDAKLFKLYS